jgi:uncharacterized protein (DUF2384 family)
MAIQATETVETLLGIDANGENMRLSLANAIMSSLPVSALDRLAGSIAPDDPRFRFRLIPRPCSNAARNRRPGI